MVFANGKHKVIHHSNGNGVNGNGKKINCNGQPKNMSGTMPPNLRKRHNHSRIKIIPSVKEERENAMARILKENRMR